MSTREELDFLRACESGHLGDEGRRLAQLESSGRFNLADSDHRQLATLVRKRYDATPVERGATIRTAVRSGPGLRQAVRR